MYHLSKQHKKYVVMALALVTIMSTLLIGCSSENSNNTNAEEKQEKVNSAMVEAESKMLESLEPLPQKDQELNLAAIESTLSNPFWITMKEGYEDAAKEYGANMDVLATDTEQDINGQLDLMNTQIAKSIDGIAISPLTELNLIPGIVEANKKDIKVVVVGNDVNKEELEKAQGQIEAYVTSDFKEQGKLGGEYVVEKTGGKGKILIIEGIPGATQSEARKNGAKEACEKAGMTVLPVQTANFDRQQAFDLTSAVIQSNPDLKGICCGNDIMALGAVEALKAKNMKDDVVVVGVDFIDEAKESIENGELDATVAMSPYLLGKAGAIATMKAIQGDTIEKTVIWTPINLVDKENVKTMDGWR